VDHDLASIAHPDARTLDRLSRAPELTGHLALDLAARSRAVGQGLDDRLLDVARAALVGAALEVLDAHVALAEHP
jgi:hypothetical protein